MKIKILPNTRKDWAVKVANELKELITQEFSITEGEADISICIGGDGTIYHYYQNGQLSGAILAIGSKTSSICQLIDSNWKNKILRFLRTKKREKRLTLVVNLDGKKFRSINDTVIHTHDYRLVGLDVGIGKENHHFDGDGIIVSTPTGSTGYAYSAGGSIIKPTEQIIQVVPICPYKRIFSPRIITQNENIKISTDRTSDLIIDGIYITRLKESQKVLISRGEDVEFLY